MEVNVYLYLRTCIFWLYMFIMILWKNDAYSSKSESAQQNQELQQGHVSDVACGSHPGEVAHGRWHQRRLARIRRGMCTSGKRRRQSAWSISQGLHAQAVACAHRLGVNGRGPHGSANNRRHRPRPARNTVVCAHLANDIGQRHAASTKA